MDVVPPALVVFTLLAEWGGLFGSTATTNRLQISVGAHP
jgi:hypothetical protein